MTRLFEDLGGRNASTVLPPKRMTRRRRITQSDRQLGAEASIEVGELFACPTSCRMMYSSSPLSSKSKNTYQHNSVMPAMRLRNKISSMSAAFCLVA